MHSGCLAGQLRHLVGFLGVFCAGPGIGLGDPYGCLPAQGIVGFCEHTRACVITGDPLHSEKKTSGSSLGTWPFGRDYSP